MPARLIHPSAANPWAALGTRADGRLIWPILGAEDEPKPDPKPADPKPDPAPEPEFPPNTPVAEMTDKQAAAYYKHQARKHEDRVKSFGGLTTEQLAELRAKAEKHDALELELSGTAEQAAAKAKADTQAENDAKYRPMLAETAFRVAIGDRKSEEEVDDFLGDLNLDRFVADDGKVDTAKVLARVEQFAPAKGTSTTLKGPTVTGHGSGSGAGSGTALTGSELYDRLHPKKKTA